MKNALCFTICILLLLSSVSGCGKNNTGQRRQTTDTASDSPITFSFFDIDQNQNYENMQSVVGRRITKLTGVTLKYEFPVGDAAQKISLMAASGDYPDLIFAGQNVGTLVSAGALLDLTDLIEQYGPNIKKMYGKYLIRNRYSKEDKSIYFLGSDPVNEEKMFPMTGFELQHAVVKELGFPKMRTIYDLENAVRNYVRKHPTIDGQKTIGMSLVPEDWRFSVSITDPSNLATGHPDDGEFCIDPKTYEAKLHYFKEGNKAYFKWLNKMYNEGLLDPESFVQKYDQYQAKIASGRVLALSDQYWSFELPEKALRDLGKPERTYGMYPLTISENTKHADFQKSGFSGGIGISISKDCKDPVRAIKFLDWMCTDEAQVLINWGIEGIHYKVKNGKRIIPHSEWRKRNTDPNYFKNTGIDVYVYPFPRHGDGALDPTGNTYTTITENTLTEKYSDIEKEVLKHYGAKTWKDLYPKASEFMEKPWGAAWQINVPQYSELNLINQKLRDIIRSKIPVIVTSPAYNFESEYSSFLKQLEDADVHKAEKEFTKLVKERVSLWKDK